MAIQQQLLTEICFKFLSLTKDHNGIRGQKGVTDSLAGADSKNQFDTKEGIVELINAS